MTKKSSDLENHNNSHHKSEELLNGFASRHIGASLNDVNSMLLELGFKDLDSFTKSVIPSEILINDSMRLDDALEEEVALSDLEKIAKKNVLKKSFIGQGYFSSFTPKVIQRNVFENPGWYTSYTPYQPEISQGRLEALINYQTMIRDLTALDIANASLLDEGTAAAEAMTLAFRSSKSESNVFLIDKNCFPQTIAVVLARAKPLDIEIKIVDLIDPEISLKCFGALMQYPGNDGSVIDFSGTIKSLHQNNALAIMATDPLALCLLKPPGELGADMAIGNSQRFGVPLGFGGPHAAFIAIKENLKRSLPGRLVGASIDRLGNVAYRLALQTREQHIRREKATSNICTAQALLAIMAGFYGVYHGRDGLKKIAINVHNHTQLLATEIRNQGWKITNHTFFDTIVVETKGQTKKLLKQAIKNGYNLREFDQNHIGISLDETANADDIHVIKELFVSNISKNNKDQVSPIPRKLKRTSEFMTHEVFNKYRSETELLRYIRRLSDKDIALDRAMIPLGSCTMKLNATSEMIPVGWKEFANIHPFSPMNQIKGYEQLIKELEQMLIAITGYAAISIQPNAGSQGEYAGLLAIDAFHSSNNETNRKICLIPESAHGTNPASAQMAGMKVIPVNCDNDGNIDMKDLKTKVKAHSKELAGIMITYPSTHGVFESTVKDVCKLIHDHGGMVYIDGANLNAMVGLCKPGQFGGDVSHLNLHKTFCIPHGGGGPGVGPVCVVEELKDFIPSDPLEYDTKNKIGPVAATKYGSASILPISWMYIKMMGGKNLKLASEVAILNANYIAAQLKDHYKILYKGKNNLIAHECILDVRPFKDSAGIEVDDIAKRLIDYGFHAPTMSFPVPGTLMIEPTESESKVEIDRFCKAMISIRQEIAAIESGTASKDNNLLKNAPHSAQDIANDNWSYPYSRESAAYPNPSLKQSKYWPPVSRIDHVYGDKNLMCSCPSMSDFKG